MITRLSFPVQIRRFLTSFEILFRFFLFYLNFLKDLRNICVLYIHSSNAEKQLIKGDTTMADIFKWFASASDKWDHTGHNDAGDVLNLIGGIFEALGF